MTNFMCSVKKQRYSHRTSIKKDGKLKDEEAILSTKGRWLKRTKNRTDKQFLMAVLITKLAHFKFF